jgi:hypothetical protein
MVSTYSDGRRAFFVMKAGKISQDKPSLIYRASVYFTKKNMHVTTDMYSIRDGKSLASYDTSAGTSGCRF